MASDTKLCFIIGPIGEAGSPERRMADFVRELIIAPVVSGHKYEIKRADDDAKPGSISQAVILDVLKADLAIADLTGLNPNAFYELGIRHMTGKPTIHLIAENRRLPFDNIDQRTIFIDTTDVASIKAAKGRMSAAVQAINREGYRDSNPITMARGNMALSESADSRDQQIASLIDRVSALESEKRGPTAALGGRMFGGNPALGGSSGLQSLTLMDRLLAGADPETAKKMAAILGPGESSDGA